MLGFWQFLLFIFVNMGPYMGEKTSNDNLSESAQQICSQKFMHTPRKGLYQSCIKNCEIWVFEFLAFFGWGGVGWIFFFPFNMIVNRNYEMCNIYYLVHIEYFWMVSVQIQFGVTWCISYFWQPCISETASRTAKRRKLWTSGLSI